MMAFPIVHTSGREPPPPSETENGTDFSPPKPSPQTLLPKASHPPPDLAMSREEWWENHGYGGKGVMKLMNDD